jgi:hypothetical protein
VSNNSNLPTLDFSKAENKVGAGLAVWGVCAYAGGAVGALVGLFPGLALIIAGIMQWLKEGGLRE